MASATAATSASLTSLPFDMIKTRIQNMKPDPATGAMPYGGVLDCGAKIARAEGVLAFGAASPPTTRAPRRTR